MITLSQLTGVPKRTYRKIFRQPIPVDVGRTAVRSLLETVGRVTADEGGRLEVIRNGHVLVLPSLGAESNEPTSELIALRHFLKRSESSPSPSNGREAHILLILGHHEAHLFRSEIYGGCPQELMPREAQNGFPSRIPKPASDPIGARFFAPISQALRATGQILIFGESLAMDSFIGWLKLKHPDQAERIIGSRVIDEDQENSAALLTNAREFYSHTRPMQTGLPSS